MGWGLLVKTKISGSLWMEGLLVIFFEIIVAGSKVFARTTIILGFISDD